MKRPLFLIAVIVLSGVICGIRETGLVMKILAASVPAAILMILKSGISGKMGIPLFLPLPSGQGSGQVRLKTGKLLAALTVFFFLSGLLRAFAVSEKYHSEECLAFYETYAATNPGQFDYALYLKSQGISDREEYERRKNEEGAEGVLLYGLQRFRSGCGEIFDSCLAESDAGIYKAVVLGDKSELDSRVRDLYQDAGIAHLLAVSGLHVSVIGAGLYELLRRKTKKKTAAVVSSAILLLYMLMTGASGSVVRAVIMLILGMAAAVCGRSYDMRSALSLSALVLMLWRPYQILTSGFQLSFGAVAAITLVCETAIHRIELLRENAGRQGAAVKRIRIRNRLPLWVRTLITGAGIQLVTLPVILYHYFQFPVYGILLNLIVIPLMTIVLCSGIGLLASGFLSGFLQSRLRLPLTEFLVLPAAAPGHYILKLYRYAAAASLKLPFATVCPGRPEVWQIVLYYCLLGTILFVFFGGRLQRGPEIWLRCAGSVLALLLSACLLRHFEYGELSVTVLDVGQGDGIAVRNRNSWILIDGGSSSRQSVGEDVLEPFFLSRGVRRLDMILVSHSDEDHINGILYLLGEESPLSAECLVLPGPAEGDPSYDGLREAFADQESIIYLRDGMQAAGEGTFELECLYAGREGEDRNRNSSVMLLKKGSFSMLFTGDTTAEDERLFSSDLSVRERIPENGISVLKVAHHGSSSSTTDEFLDCFRPAAAVISCGRNNRYGHPSPEVTERLKKRGIRILQTTELGAVRIRPDFRKTDRN